MNQYSPPPTNQNGEYQNNINPDKQEQVVCPYCSMLTDNGNACSFCGREFYSPNPRQQYQTQGSYVQQQPSYQNPQYNPYPRQAPPPQGVYNPYPYQQPPPKNNTALVAVIIIVSVIVFLSIIVAVIGAIVSSLNEFSNNEYYDPYEYYDDYDEYDDYDDYDENLPWWEDSEYESSSDDDVDNSTIINGVQIYSSEASVLTDEDGNRYLYFLLFFYNEKDKIVSFSSKDFIVQNNTDFEASPTTEMDAEFSMTSMKDFAIPGYQSSLSELLFEIDDITEYTLSITVDGKLVEIDAGDLID